MSRTRWKVPLRCRKCFYSGEAIFSHQIDGPADIRVEFLAPGFRVVPSKRTPDRMDVICEACGISARADFRVRRTVGQWLAEMRRKFWPKWTGRTRPKDRAAAIHR